VAPAPVKVFCAKLRVPSANARRITTAKRLNKFNVLLLSLMAQF
jgi:hypothetical protein